MRIGIDEPHNQSASGFRLVSWQDGYIALRLILSSVFSN
jgi:hypothetical protein